MVGIDFLWTVGFFFSHVLQCYPISVNWTNLGNIEGKCLNTNLMYMFMGWSDVATNGELSLIASVLPRFLIGA